MMKKHLAIATMLSLLLFPGCSLLLTPDLAGIWRGELVLENGYGIPMTMHLIQTGKAIAGEIVYRSYSYEIRSGLLDGTRIELTARYDGSHWLLDSDSRLTLSGNVRNSHMSGEGRIDSRLITWWATKQ